MPTSTTVPLSEYLETVYRPDCEYLDGELLERNVGEWDHSRLQASLTGYLFAREKHYGIVVATEQRVQVKATRFRVPDILVLISPAPTGPIVNEPPFLCIEILSPSDQLTQMQDRIYDYLRFGVNYVWVVDPRTRQAFIYTSDTVSEVQDGVLRTSNPEIVVPFSDL